MWGIAVGVIPGRSTVVSGISGARVVTAGIAFRWARGKVNKGRQEEEIQALLVMCGLPVASLLSLTHTCLCCCNDHPEGKGTRPSWTSWGPGEGVEVHKNPGLGTWELWRHLINRVPGCKTDSPGGRGAQRVTYACSLVPRMPFVWVGDLHSVLGNSASVLKVLEMVTLLRKKKNIYIKYNHTHIISHTKILYKIFLYKNIR